MQSRSSSWASQSCQHRRRLHALADALASDNSVEFERDGHRITVSVPAEVDMKIEVELGEENELEIELTW